MRVRIGRGFWSSRAGLGLLAVAGLALFLAAVSFVAVYIHFARVIDARLAGPVFQATSHVFGAPRQVGLGEKLTLSELATYLRRAGYTESELPLADLPDTLGRFKISGHSIEIRPGSNSFFSRHNALRVEIVGNEVSRILSLDDGSWREVAEVEPALITNLFDQRREKRRLVRFADLPKVLVDAVLTAEDRRFFEHAGIDFIGIARAALVDIRRGEKAQGGSTITMQVARNFFLTPSRTWRRKLAEILIAIQLEQRFTKEEIFELYANQVYLGNRGSFSLNGFGEAAQVYFNKDVKQLSLPEAAYLAAIIRGPNLFSPQRYPERAAGARNNLIEAMAEHGVVSRAEADAARRTPLEVARGSVGASDAPYFVDMVKDRLLDRYSESDLISQSYRIYTTLDLDLQRAAAEAVRLGMAEMDKQVAARYRRGKARGEEVPPVQVALVALDPKTGEIKALIGGRDYGQSQLNRAVARRQPGSVFKPFVYAAAFSNGVEGRQPMVTPTTEVLDSPTTFTFEGQEYTPNNYGDQFHGVVSLRTALALSLNVATVGLAEMIGYDRVVDISQRVGFGNHIKATPAVALGAYELTPVEVAAGYTAFANGGARTDPLFITQVTTPDGKLLERNPPQTHPALDPRVAFLMTNMMEDVLNRGTGVVVRARGFSAPAAGKTGTSHDGWFAGYTSNLLCVVWVGYDDNRELGLSGAASAAPIWAEFMKRAVELVPYRGVQPFVAPEGIVMATVDPESGELATALCSTSLQEAFVAGTEPTSYCVLHGGEQAAGATGEHPSWLSRLFGTKQQTGTQPAAAPTEGGSQGHTAVSGTENPSIGGQPPAGPGKATPDSAEPKKKSVLRRFWGALAGEKKEKKTEEKDQAKP